VESTKKISAEQALAFTDTHSRPSWLAIGPLFPISLQRRRGGHDECIPDDPVHYEA